MSTIKQLAVMVLCSVLLVPVTYAQYYRSGTERFPAYIQYFDELPTAEEKKKFLMGLERYMMFSEERKKQHQKLHPIYKTFPLNNNEIMNDLEMYKFHTEYQKPKIPNRVVKNEDPAQEIWSSEILQKIKVNPKYSAMSDEEFRRIPMDIKYVALPVKTRQSLFDMKKKGKLALPGYNLNNIKIIINQRHPDACGACMDVERKGGPLSGDGSVDTGTESQYGFSTGFLDDEDCRVTDEMRNNIKELYSYSTAILIENDIELIELTEKIPNKCDRARLEFLTKFLTDVIKE